MPLTPDQLRDDLVSLAQVLGAKRYEANDFEMDVWRRVLEHPALQPGQFRAFLQQHTLSSPFAPQPSDAVTALGLQPGSGQMMRELHALVRSHGPWQLPPCNDPVLIATIQLMGGWPAVNQRMPDLNDPANSFAIKQFADDFESCFKQAVTQVLIQGRAIAPLQALGNAAAASPLLGHRTETPRNL